MSPKKQKNKTQSAAKPKLVRNSTFFNYHDFKIKNTGKLLIGSIVLLVLFLFGIFKNISYPLMWADESMTAMGTERVLQYGYPKVHDGRNIFYDLNHNNPKLGVHEKDDAYVGGAGWAQYYYGILGYKLAQLTDNIYAKTAIYRTTFALAGLAGLFLLVFFISGIFKDKFSRYAFFFLFLLLELRSVSLMLLIREVRYYALVMLLISLILSLYGWFRFYRPFNKMILIAILSVSLWVLFLTFAPVYFILVGTIGLSEIVNGVYDWRKSGFMTSLKNNYPIVLSLVISLIAVIPLLSYFKTFEISKAMELRNNFDNTAYWVNVKNVFNYFKIFEILWLAVVLKLLLLVDIKTFLKEKPVSIRISSFLTVLFIIYALMIARIPNYMYTRYFISLQPILMVIILLDLFSVLKLYGQNSKSLLSLKMVGLACIFIAFFLHSIISNSENILGHAYELSHQNKGPLDYMIPFIKEKYPNPDSLVIATNYEETSYMYYLNSKVVIGYLGYNLFADTSAVPDLISVRQQWGKFNVFKYLIKKANYEPQSFPVKDVPVNTIPELHFRPPFNHLFRTPVPDSAVESTILYIKQ